MTHYDNENVGGSKGGMWQQIWQASEAAVAKTIAAVAKTRPRPTNAM